MRRLTALLTVGVLCLASSPMIAKTQMTPQARAAQKRAKKQQKAMKKFSKAKAKERKTAKR